MKKSKYISINTAIQDKVNVTGKLKNKAKQKELLNKVSSGITKSDNRLIHANKKMFNNLRRRYHKVYLIRISKSLSDFAVLCLSPKGKFKKAGFILLILNLAKLSKKEVYVLQDRLVALLGKKLLAKVLIKGNYTRNDITVDVSGYMMQDIAVHYSNQQLSEYSGIDNPTYYSGDKSGKHSFLRLYDKIAQLERKGITISHNEPVLRFEVCYLTSIPFTKLTKLHNQFKRIKVYSTDFYEDNYFSSEFIEECKLNGLSNALALIDERSDKEKRKVKDRYLYRLNKRYSIKMFDYTKLEKSWKKSINKLKKLIPNKT